MSPTLKFNAKRSENHSGETNVLVELQMKHTQFYVSLFALVHICNKKFENKIDHIPESPILLQEEFCTTDFLFAIINILCLQGQSLRKNMTLNDL